MNKNDAATALTDAGIAAAVDHANRESLAWSDRAVSFIHIYAVLHEELTCELVRLWSEPLGMPKAPDGRAWGWCMRKARKNGWVEKTDRVMTATDPKVHKNRCAVWRSLLRQGLAGSPFVSALASASGASTSSTSRNTALKA